MKRVQILVLLAILVLVPCTVQGTVFSLLVLDAGTGIPVPDALVYVNGDYAGKTAASGAFQYSHALNASFYLKVTKTGYVDQVSLIEPDRISGQVILSRKDLTLTVALFDGTTFQPVSGALVTLSGENLSASAQSDVNGRAVLTAKAYGQYSVDVRVPHYERLVRTVEMGTADTSVQFWLYRSDQLLIQARDAAAGTAIADANVTVDGVPRGSTDRSGRLVLFLEKERNYQIRVESTGYTPYTADRYLTTGDIVLTVPLSREMERVTVSAFDEDRRPVEAADVLVDGVLSGATDPYGRVVLLKVEHGLHQVLVKKAGYLAAGGTFEINRSWADLVLEMPFAPGEVVVSVRDAADGSVLREGARIGINGQEKGLTGKDGSIRINLTTSRTYNISAALPGFGAQFREVDIPLGAVTLPVEFTLIRDPDYTLLIVVAAGVVLVLTVFGIRRLQRDRRRNRIFRRR
jgi:hypothetical protein